MNIAQIASIISPIIAVIALLYAVKKSRTKKPTWAYYTRQVIGHDAESPPELKYTFGNKEVEEVYITKIIFFNRGNEKYCGNLIPGGDSDVNAPVFIGLGGAQILRPPEIKSKSKGVANKFSVEPNSQDGVVGLELNFGILGHHDDALIEIWHTRCEKKIDIINADVQLLKDFIKERPKKLAQSLFIDVLIGAFFLALIGYYIATNRTTADTITGILFIIGLIWFTAAMVLKDLRFLNFPSWSRIAKN